MNWILPTPGIPRDWAFDDDRYTPQARGLMRAYVDVWAAVAYGYERTRQPRPGQPINMRRYREWRDEKLPEAFSQSLLSDPTMPRDMKKTIEGIPEHLLQYFYQRCLAAKRLSSQVQRGVTAFSDDL